MLSAGRRAPDPGEAAVKTATVERLTGPSRSIWLCIETVRGHHNIAPRDGAQK
jgi:hypothetical protein